jgi:hypothetical protein
MGEARAKHHLKPNYDSCKQTQYNAYSYMQKVTHNLFPEIKSQHNHNQHNPNHHFIFPHPYSPDNTDSG